MMFGVYPVCFRFYCLGDSSVESFMEWQDVWFPVKIAASDS